MPCGTSSAVSTIPATRSRCSQARSYVRATRRPGNQRSSPARTGCEPSAVTANAPAPPYTRLPPTSTRPGRSYDAPGLRHDGRDSGPLRLVPGVDRHARGDIVPACESPLGSRTPSCQGSRATTLATLRAIASPVDRSTLAERAARAIEILRSRRRRSVVGRRPVGGGTDVAKVGARETDATPLEG